MRIAIIAVEGSLLSAVAGLSDLFWLTNQALQRPPQGATTGIEHPDKITFETSIVGLYGRSLRDPQGKMIAVDGAFQASPAYDAVLVAGMALGADGLPPNSDSFRKAARWLHACHQQGAWIGAACAGTFVAGEAGLLNERRCTTTWWSYNDFRQRFPKARLEWGSAVEEQDKIITTGGPLSWVNLGLHVIRRLAGEDVARLAADMSLTDSRPLSQVLYAPRGFVNLADPLLQRAEQIIRHANPGIAVEDLAQALNLNERALHRRLKDLINETPKEFMTRVRIETACALLDTPGVSLKQVAKQCGYSEESSFRRAFNQWIGMTPGDYRRWSNERSKRTPCMRPPHF